MIPRTLVPRELSRAALAAGDLPARSRTSLDERTLVLPEWPVVALNGRSTIPAHVPLDVLAPRTLVPKDLPALSPEQRAPLAASPTLLDARFVVPRDMKLTPLPARGPIPRAELPGVLDPDLLTTGEVNLLVAPLAERRGLSSFQATLSSVAFHALVIALILLQPKLFPYRPAAQSELELARRQLAFIYLPPQVRDVPRVPLPPGAQSSPNIKIDPRVLQQVAPPDEQPLRGPSESPRVLRELPPAPAPQSSESEEARRRDSERRIARLETPKSPEETQSQNPLLLPRVSPGKALEESLRGAVRGRGTGDVGFGDRTAPQPGGGGGQGYLGGTVQMLTPDEGVDFSNYLARVLASVRRNWYAVIPESARLGEKGKVVLQFHILRNGSVPLGQPALVSTSSKEPLDRAALSSIRASSPFEPLPPAFSGPYIELRFIFLYNLPLDYQ